VGNIGANFHHREHASHFDVAVGTAPAIMGKVFSGSGICMVMSAMPVAP
jgi:hypothetical protein